MVLDSVVRQAGGDACPLSLAALASVFSRHLNGPSKQRKHSHHKGQCNKGDFGEIHQRSELRNSFKTKASESNWKPGRPARSMCYSLSTMRKKYNSGR